MRPSNNLKSKTFRHILKSSASMYEISVSQFFRTTSGIQSGPEAFDKLSFVKTFLTILWVTEILRSFRLVLEGKIDKEIPESSRSEFSEKFLANNFALSYAKDNTCRTVNGRGLTDLPLLKTLLAICQKSWESNFWKVMDTCFSSICKCGSLRNHLALITSLSELYFRFWRFIVLVQAKKEISMNCGSSTCYWNPWRWVRFDLILMMSDIYINSNLNLLTEFTSSSRSTEFKDILPWNILQMITKSVPISTKIVISYAMRILF